MFKLEILTTSGFRPFVGIRKQTKSEYVRLEAGVYKLDCSVDHKLLTPTGWKEAQDLQIGDVLLTSNRKEVVNKIEVLREPIDVYDPLEVANGHEYISNGLISHNCSFLGSSFTLINANKIETLHYEEPLGTDGFFSVFKHPTPGHNYVMAVDSSDGVNRDFSTFSVVDVSALPYEVVATYRDNRIEPLMFPDIIYKVATHYNKANIVCENNNMGQQVANVLYFDYEYEHIFTSVKEFGANEVDEGMARLRPGLRTTKTTKRIGCSNLKTLIESDQLIVNDFTIIEEFSRFIKTKNSYAADEGAHDDLVMTLILFAWLTTQPYFMQLTDTNMRQNLHSKRIADIRESMVPFGMIDSGNSGFDAVIDLDGIDFEEFLKS